MIFNYQGRKLNLKVKRSGVIMLDENDGTSLFSEEIGTLKKWVSGYVLYINNKKYDCYGTRKYTIYNALKIYFMEKELRRVKVASELKIHKEKVDMFLNRIKIAYSKSLNEKTYKEIDDILDNEKVVDYVCLELNNGEGNSEPSVSVHFGFAGKEARVVLGSIGYIPRNFDELELVIESSKNLLSLGKTCEYLLKKYFKK